MLSKVLAKLGLVKRKYGEPKPFLWDIAQWERIVEYGWVLRELGTCKRCSTILDVGYWGTMFPIMLASLGYKVVGIDIRSYTYLHPNFSFIQGDILKRSLLSNYRFDVIIMVSTLEHVGILHHTDESLDLDADRKALQILSEVLNDQGIILITIPVGRAKILKRYKNPWESFSTSIIPSPHSVTSIGGIEFVICLASFTISW